MVGNNDNTIKLCYFRQLGKYSKYYFVKADDAVKLILTII